MERDPFTGRYRQPGAPDLGIEYGGFGTGGPPVVRRGGGLLPWLIAGAVLLFLVAPAIARRLVDWLWYREIGFERVFLTRMGAQWALALVVGIPTFAFFYANARRALKGMQRGGFVGGPFRGPGPGQNPLVRFVATFATAVAVALTTLFALGASTEWETVLRFVNRTPFGVADPVFGRDVGYYVFTIPLIGATLGYLQLLFVAGFALIALPIYVAREAVSGRGSRIRVDSGAGRHLALLGASFFVLIGLEVLLIRVPSVLQSSHTPLRGASFTDLHLLIPLLRITGALMVVAPIALLVQAWRDRLNLRVAVWIGGPIAVMLLMLAVAPVVFQKLVVQPNELAREAAQIGHHIAATRRAWDIDRVDRRDLSGERTLNAQIVAANSATTSNVRLWDRDPLLQTYGQIQAILTYYNFLDVDDDRYMVNGELRQVLLSARELDPAALPSRTFVNEHLTFTHGMGLTLGPANQVTSEGLPVLWIKDLPPVSSVPMNITRPQIYFGEMTTDFVLAPSRQREFDFPSGEGATAAYSAYAGSAGVPIAGILRRLLFAYTFGSHNILMTGDLTEDTRIIFHRNIRVRAQRALPFLRFDGDPYIVITDDGRLVWMLDAYTSTDRYPYSYPLNDGTSYMRNSVKVAIDAYDGDVRAYLADPDDPIIRTQMRIYPGLLQPMDEMPADLRSHVRYPGDLFRAQTALYATFHMTDPETFYHREDQWQIPISGDQRGPGEGFMRHMVMRLPGERAPEFILMRPFTPRQKDNLAAWMVVRNDGENYGKMIAYRFPRQSLVYGPTQIVNRINQDTDVARQVSLWEQQRTQVIRGELLVIPIEESLMYVQPLYLRAVDGRIPELKRVIVAYENRVVMEETLEAGLARLFGGAVRTPSEQTTPAADPAIPASPTATAAGAAAAALIQQAIEHYERARAAQRADDWTTYGEEMRRLGEILRRIRPPE